MKSRTFGRAASVAFVVALTLIGVGQSAAGASGRSGAGYWSTDAAGRVSTVGDAKRFGDLRKLRLRAPVSGIAGAPGGQGYWLVARDGGVFTFGSARFRGSAANLVLNAPVVGIAATPSGNGYWLVAADGGVFTYGDAKFYGSAGNLSLRAPVVGIAATPSGRGYWLGAADGGVFTYGDARFYGSAGNITLSAPVVGIAARTTGRGYWLVTRAAEIRAYGDAPVLGGNETRGERPAAGIAASPFGGYVVRRTTGNVIAAFGTANHCDGESPNSPPGAPPVVGIAVAFDASVVATEIAATQCPHMAGIGGVTGPFPVSSPWHIDASGPESCAIFTAFMDGGAVGIPLRLETNIVDRSGRLEMRAVQMNTHKRFQVYARGECLYVVRAGTGGTQTLPFTTKSGGDSLPFTSASTITIEATVPRPPGWPTTTAGTTPDPRCTVDVYADSDGHRVAGSAGSSGSTFSFQVPAGTYFVSSTVFCTVKVS